MKVFKIFNIPTRKYVSMGYNSKNSWKRWPSDAISTGRLRNPNFDNEHVIEEYELVKTKTYSPDKSSL